MPILHEVDELGILETKVGGRGSVIKILTFRHRSNQNFQNKFIYLCTPILTLLCDR